MCQLHVKLISYARRPISVTFYFFYFIFFTTHKIYLINKINEGSMESHSAIVKGLFNGSLLNLGVFGVVSRRA